MDQDLKTKPQRLAFSECKIRPGSFCSRSPTAEARRRERRQCRCESCREHQPSLFELRLGEPVWPASIKVMQRTFNPQNRAHYPGGPPASDWIDGFMDYWRNAPTVFHGGFSAIHFLINPLPQFFLPGRLIVGQRPLKARMLVRFQPRQPISIFDFGFAIYEPALEWERVAQIVIRKS